MSSPPMRAGRRSTTGVSASSPAPPADARSAEINSCRPAASSSSASAPASRCRVYDREHRVVGVDLSPRHARARRKRVADDKLAHVEALHEMDASKLTFADAQLRRGDGDVRHHRGSRSRPRARRDGPRRAAGRARRPRQPFLGRHRPARLVERWLSRFSARLGWRPNFPIERVLGRPELRLIERRPVKSLRPLHAAGVRAGLVNLRLGQARRAFQEIEVAALVGLRDVLGVEAVVAAREVLRRAAANAASRRAISLSRHVEV